MQPLDQSLYERFSNSGSLSQAAKAKAHKLAANKVYRAHRRTVDRSFVAAERASRKKYRDFNRDFNRWCRGFAASYPNQFQAYINSGVQPE